MCPPMPELSASCIRKVSCVLVHHVIVWRGRIVSILVTSTRLLDEDFYIDKLAKLASSEPTIVYHRATKQGARVALFSRVLFFLSFMSGPLIP